MNIELVSFALVVYFTRTFVPRGVLERNDKGEECNGQGRDDGTVPEL